MLIAGARRWCPVCAVILAALCERQLAGGCWDRVVPCGFPVGVERGVRRRVLEWAGGALRDAVDVEMMKGLGV